MESNINDRIERLENQLKRQRVIINTTLCLSVLLSAVISAEVLGIDLLRPKVIRAQSFVLQDQNGAIRSEWSVKHDETLFSMYDRNGIPRCAIFSEPDSSGYHVYDENGVRRSVLGYSNNETSLVFMNSGGIYQSGLVAKSNGISAFQLRNEKPVPIIDTLLPKMNEL